MASQVCGVDALYLQADPFNRPITGKITKRPSSFKRRNPMALIMAIPSIYVAVTGCCLIGTTKLFPSNVFGMKKPGKYSKERKWQYKL